MDVRASSVDSPTGETAGIGKGSQLDSGEVSELATQITLLNELDGKGVYQEMPAVRPAR